MNAFPSNSYNPISILGVGLALFFSVGVVTGIQAQTTTESPVEADCLLCHDGSDPDVARVTSADIENSIHEGMECVDCHVTVVELPHEDDLPPVPCGECHEDQGADYVSHGFRQRGDVDGIPECSDCHGSHDIRPADDPESMASPEKLASTCGQCHGDLNLARDHDLRLKRVVELYESTVHGMASAAGDRSAAVCSDCHGVGGDPHRIFAAGRNLSSINHFNIPNTCGTCHEEIAEEYWSGVHGSRVARGDTHSPVCTDCHGEHGILPVDDPRSNVSPYRVAEATCDPCHSSALLNEDYDLDLGAGVTHVDSFHGLKSRSGDMTVANCASCHGAHSALPPSDPRSRVHPANLEATCGECHHGINAEMARVPIHGGLAKSGWEKIVARIYIVLIVFVIGGMLGFVTLDYRRHMQDSLRLPQVRRMTPNAVAQHMVLAVSFTLLVITGFALSYSEAWIFRVFFGWDGGAAFRGLLHRGSAVVFMGGVVWHMIYLRSPDGRAFLSGMMPGMRDVRELNESVAYNLGRSRKKPRFGRFGFVEKAEYWALVWGTVVMAITGLLLWFRGPAVDLFSGTFVSVMRVIHLLEAWLAALAILIWHSYGTLYKPGVYPGNPSWITGKMPRHMYEEEHPGDPLPEEEPETKPAPSKEARRP